MDIYDRIDKLLMNMGKTKRQMCIDAGISYDSYITSNRRRSNKLPFETLIAIASFLGVSVDYLLENDSEVGIFISNLKDIEHLQIYRRLNSKGKEKVTQYAMDITDRYSESQCRFGSKVTLHSQDEDIRMLPLYDYAASAGRGAFTGYGDYELAAVPEGAPASTSFGVRISGDSMEPKIPDGSIVWVRQQPDVDRGQICLVIINEDGYCKVKGENSFQSLNKKYKDIKPGMDDEVIISGLVVYIQPPDEQ